MLKSKERPKIERFGNEYRFATFNTTVKDNDDVFVSLKTSYSFFFSLHDRYGRNVSKSLWFDGFELHVSEIAAFHLDRYVIDALRESLYVHAHALMQAHAYTTSLN